VVALAACAAPPQPPLHNAAIVKPPTMVLRMQRTECGFKCPEYTVEVASDGSVAWTGEANVATVGVAHGNVSVHDLDRLIAAFEVDRFFAIEKAPKFHVECLNGAGHKCITVICSGLDESTTRVTLVRAGALHTLEVDCDPAFARAAKLVDELARTSAWIGAGS
jgi:hypothetical protein